MKLNNKGVSIIEIVLTFALIMVMTMGMLSIVFNYREKASISMEKLDLDTFKNTLTKEIQDDILTLGVKEINTSGECLTNAELNSCINIVFLDGTSKAFGTSKVNNNDVDSIENKFLYYGSWSNGDGLKYRIVDKLPSKIPIGEKAVDFQTIKIQDQNILSTDSMVLENGTVVTFYSIDVYISHIDFDEDFGIHITTTSEVTK